MVDELETQITINILKHDLDHTDEDEIVNKDENGEYKQ